MRLLVLGGTRSGKSARAEALAASFGAPVVYVATARRDESDSEMLARIAGHQSRRPENWTTIETLDIPKVLREISTEGSKAQTPTVLIDDVGGWLTQVLDQTSGWTGQDSTAYNQEVSRLLEAVASYGGDLVLVSPEVGLGVVAPSKSGRIFADRLGELNTSLADLSDTTELVVAGRIVTVDRPATSSAEAARPVEVEAPPTPTPSPPAEFALNASVSAPISEPTVFEPVRPPAREWADQARQRHLGLTKPPGSLGLLEELSMWISSCQEQCPPRPITNARVVVFAGDHGVANHGVSAYPQEVTAQMVSNILAGGAAVSVLARSAGASVRVADIAVAAECPPTVSKHKVRRSSGSIDREDALSEHEVSTALAVGRSIADEEIESGADLLIAGDLGIGNTTPATVLACLYTGKEPVSLVGRGTGIDDAGWMRKTAAIRDAMFRCRHHLRDPVALLQMTGGADLAAMAGFLAQAALRRTPVLLDGSVVTAAAVVADALAPGSVSWWKAGHLSAEPAHAATLHYLGLDPILKFDMRLGEGSGAVAALPVLHSAVAILSDMATFADAGVSDKG